MAHIDVTRTHALGLEGARETMEQVAADLKDEFPFRTYWEDDTLIARGTGFDAEFVTEPEQVRVLVRLGMFLRPMRRKIHDEIEAYLDRYIA